MATKIGVGRATMNAQGRVTLPIEVRRRLRLEAGASFEVEIIDGKVVFSPVILVPREDAWAYTPEHRALVEQAREDVREGRVYQLGRAELERLVTDADVQ